MRIILDTNVLLVIIPSKSKYNNVYLALQTQNIEVILSSEILLEYEEQLKLRYKFGSVDEELEIFLQQNNIHFYTPTYFWNLIPNDPDDNKFVDCAIDADVDYIITNDKHFDILKTIDFPIVSTLTLQEFMTILQPK